jgi:hypothetical protein
MTRPTNAGRIAIREDADPETYLCDFCGVEMLWIDVHTCEDCDLDIACSKCITRCDCEL